ncbi:MAG: hypothetical protein CL947_01735 [Epsilonproteobacteria bacterium]|nr:hypothetical protein [Campylobacterota bacterium]
MNIKKIWFTVVMLYTSNNFTDSQTANSVASHGKGWCATLLAPWEFLGIHIQLMIQLTLVLITFYLFTCLLRCKKKC